MLILVFCFAGGDFSQAIFCVTRLIVLFFILADGCDLSQFLFILFFL